METQKSEFSHVKGELAYKILWKKTFNCQKSLKSIKSHYRNLELILYNNVGIVAFKYETPDSLERAISNDGEWQMYDIEKFSIDIWVTNILQNYKDIP